MKKVIAGLCLVVILGGGYYFLKNNEIKTEEIIKVDDINKEDISKEVNTSKDSLTEQKGTLLKAGSITLISPIDNQKFTSGSSIEVKYKLSQQVKFGTIIIGPSESCTHMINEEEGIGEHSFTCNLSDQIGEIKIGLQELIYSPGVKEEKAQGKLILVASNNISVKDIEYYPESVFIMTNTRNLELGSTLSFKVVYSDGTKKDVNTSDFNFKISDSSYAEITRKNGTSLTIRGKKEGETTLSVSYQGINKIIPINIYPEDTSMQ
ncbi:MAG: hypothetical protein KBC11_00650 [Candidatus Pacebacteria bacterium]|nr:hypothetical protein [Candidatus Paceibacterota bacterium]